MLTAASLGVLARAVQDKSLVLAMYLNVPTTKLVNIRIDGDEKNIDNENQCLTMLQLWKQMRTTDKEKDKVADLQRGLKEAGFTEIAEVVEERAKENLEVTFDSLPAA